MPCYTEYDFEEVPAIMPNGVTLYLSGTFNISYQMQPADPDVGIFSAYPEFDITDDWVTVRGFDDDALGEDDITIRLPWLPGKSGRHDPLGQIYDQVHDKIDQHCRDEGW